MIFLTACNHSPYKKSNYAGDVPDSNIAQGAALAKKYCQSCHQLPDPSVADAKTWHLGILPAMGPRLGIYRFLATAYPPPGNDRFLPKGFFPAKPLLTQTEWQEIIDYYVTLAPDILPTQQRTIAIEKNQAPFRASAPAFSAPVPATSYIHFDSSDGKGRIILADAITKTVFDYSTELKIIDSLKVGAAVVDMQRLDRQWMACNIGILNPNNGRFGSIFPLAIKDNKISRDSTVLDSLARPVQLEVTDLDADGLSDYLLCEFGNNTGLLSWYRNKGGKTFERRVLRAVPGAIRTVLNDYNHDGLPDIWCLFSQGDEGIFLFTNKGGGHFEQQELIRFPSINGSSYFELDDFNGDGFPDILYTCGDNADFSAIYKPYHGVYIYLNDGHNHFSQKYFYPLNGCYKAVARDFDGDGDLDIATISFFADYQRQPEEGFVYFENKGNFQFQPSSLEATQQGRWLTMDVNDVDGDGKPDILLGNFSIAPSFATEHYDWKKGPAFLLLRNIH